MFIVALFTIAKTWNQPKCPSMTNWIKKMWHLYTMEYYEAIKKDEFMSFGWTWMKLETIILSKLTLERKNQTWCVLTHKWELIKGNRWTQGGEHHTLGPRWEARGEIALGEIPGEWGDWGGITLGEISNVGDRGWIQQITMPCAYLCNNPPQSAYVPQDLEYSKKIK